MEIRSQLQNLTKTSFKHGLGWDLKKNFELREFVNFLHSCEAAMVHIKALEILNDCNEIRKILSKLPDWLTARWSGKLLRFKNKIISSPPSANL